MKSSKFLLPAGIIFLALIIVLFYIFNKKKEPISYDQKFDPYITAHSTGYLSKESRIMVRLMNEVPKEAQLKLQGIRLFKFSPSIKGQTRWLDGFTLEFVPAEPMPTASLFEASFALGKIYKVSKDCQTFKFDFQVIPQSFDVVVDGIKSIEKLKPEWQQIQGRILTADVENPELIGKVLEANQEGRKLKIRWETGGDQKSFLFTIDSIVRGENPSVVLLEWNGNQIGVDRTGNKEVAVPSVDEFSLTEYKIVYNPEPYLLLQFSSSLLENQDLNGLIRIGNTESLRFDVSENEIRVYTPSRLKGMQDVIVDNGIQNYLRKKLIESSQFTVTYEELLPAVRLVNNGIIMPNSGNLAFPFEAVNLKAVDVKVTKILEKNIKQFLQVNTIGGDYELRRVGTIIANKTIQLDNDKLLDMNKWNRFSIDLKSMIEGEPGAIYQITIGFKHEYSLYNCQENQNSIVKTGEMDDSDDEEYYYYEGDYYSEEDDYYGYYYPPGYRWSQRDNPCHVSYFTSDRWIKQNVLASDLGIIVKSGSDNRLHIVVNDLITTRPVSGAKIEIYNYQQVLIGSGTSNSDGMLEIVPEGTPYLLIAAQSEQKGYLRLDDGSSLSMSKFDISGERTQKGIKGFIYGERGVWRPGDTLFMKFILEVKLKTIPENHPVSFELFNPAGQMVKKIIRTESEHGIYDFPVTTASDAPTGTWNCKVKIGGAEFQKNLRIETIMPNRLKLSLQFASQLSNNQKNTGILQANWLHGSPAKKLKARVETTLVSSKTEFSKFKGFNFDDPSRKFNGEGRIILDQETDDNGKATFSPEFNISEASGMMNAIFMTRVFEPGGNVSIDRFSIPFSPYKRYIGLSFPGNQQNRNDILIDSTYKLKIVAVTQAGSKVNSNMTVDVELYKVEWRWWWDRTDEDLTNYNASGYNKPMKRETISLIDGEGTYKLEIKYPEWGRYLLRVCDSDGGHSTGSTFYVSWGNRYNHASNDQPGGATMLNFTAEKSNYNVGDIVKLSIPSGKQGRMLVSIENGSRVIQKQWVEATQGQTSFSFKATSEMTPNVYVNISLLQPHSQTLNDLPIRLYGVLPIMVEDPSTKLQPVIAMKEVLRPEEKSKITVSEKNGREMTYSIAIVDDGLLDLTRFKTPEPWSTFYARESLGVKSWDMYDNVLGAWSAQLERMFSIGGDEYNRPKEDNKAKRFKPVVINLGPFHLKKGEKASHDFTMPQYVGSVRAMVVAAYDGAYGSSEKTIPVRKPLMLLATLPRVLGPTETVSLPVSVFALEKSVKDVKVEVETNDLFSIEGDNKLGTTFTEPGDKLVVFHLKAKALTGIGKVKIKAVSGSESSEYTLEIEIRNPNPFTSKVMDTLIKAGQKLSLPYETFGMAGTNKGIIEVTGFYPLNLGKRLDYLMQYPYGCIEQTTSAVFPQLYLTKLMDVPENLKSRIELNIKTGIQRLVSFQLPNGGLSYWPGLNYGDEWATSYAGHFLIEAQSLGYDIPPQLLDQWKRYQRSQAQNWNYDQTFYRSSLVQAYRLYTLALAKSPELGAMNRLRERTNLAPETKWCLAAAYQLAGQPEAARELVRETSTTVTKYTEMGYTYGSETRDRAIILEALSQMGDITKATPIMKEISQKLSSNEWMSTQTSAFCLVATARFVEKAGITNKLKFTIDINNKSQEINTDALFSQMELPVAKTSNKVEIKNNGSGMLFARIILSGQAVTGDQQEKRENNLKMSVVYKTAEGKILDVSKLTQGTDFIAEVTISNPGIMGNYQQMVLSEIFPSGWEIHNTRLFGAEGTPLTSSFTYQDIRDDRVYTYFDLRENQSVTYHVMLNASYTGRFFLPPTLCEAMYDASVHSILPGKWVEVVK